MKEMPTIIAMMTMMTMIMTMEFPASLSTEFDGL